MLVEDYAFSLNANNRKGGLIGLAAATVALAGNADTFLMQIVPPVLNSLTDQDCRVRYYACEALYNIAKVTRKKFIIFFQDVFDALCRLAADTDPNVQNAAQLLDRLVKDIVTESPSFGMEAFVPLLRERLTVLNPYVRQFLVAWIIVLDSVPDIDVLQFLPELLDGLLDMLSDPNREIRQQADFALLEFLQQIKSADNVDVGRMSHILVSRAASPDEFTQLTAITWLHEFVTLSGEKMHPYMAEVLGVILPCLSHSEEHIRQVALQTNAKLLEFDAGDGQREGGHQAEGPLVDLQLANQVPRHCAGGPGRHGMRTNGDLLGPLGPGGGASARGASEPRAGGPPLRGDGAVRFGALQGAAHAPRAAREPGRAEVMRDPRRAAGLPQARLPPRNRAGPALRQGGGASPKPNSAHRARDGRAVPAAAAVPTGRAGAGPATGALRLVVPQPHGRGEPLPAHASVPPRLHAHL
eukprot:6802418-Pyramimonas_sp.AAC.1